MKALTKRIVYMLPLAAVLLLPLAAAQEYPDGDICRVFANGTLIRDPHSDKQYITCIDYTSQYTKCGTTTPYYDKDTKKCVKTLPEDSIVHVNCTKSTGKFIYDPASCVGYYYCQDEETPLFGKCPDEMFFNATRQSCIYKHESSCKTSQFDYCSMVSNKDTVNVRDTSHCRKYYSCKKGVMKAETCSKTLYYNPIKGACEQISQVECANHPLPTDVCGTDKKPIVNTHVPDERSCSGYYFCEQRYDGVYPIWGQCPPDSFFDSKQKSCVKPSDISCDFDRCVGQTKAFVTSSKKGCRHYFRCENGKTSGKEMDCGNKFFDEDLGACISTIVKYKTCS